MPRKKVVKEEGETHEHWHKYKQDKGWKILILGLLVLGNNYWNVVSWPAFIGIIIALAGIVKLAMPKRK